MSFEQHPTQGQGKERKKEWGLKVNFMIFNYRRLKQSFWRGDGG